MDLSRTSIPEGFTAYKSTPEFTATSVPAGLLRAHNTKVGVWGLLVVTAGRLRFVLEDEGRHETGAASAAGLRHRELVAGEQLAIEPEVRHHVELLVPETRFQLTFYRARPG